MDVESILMWFLQAVSVVLTVLGVLACVVVLVISFYAIVLLFIAAITGVGL